MKSELKYVLLNQIVGAVIASVIFLYATADAMDELSSTKAQLAISNDYISDLENDLNSCKSDVDFLKDGVEDMIKVCKVVK